MKRAILLVNYRLWGTLIKKHQKILIVTIIVLTFLSVSQGIPSIAAETTQPSWTNLSPMPTARGGFGAAVVGGKIYAIGGLNDNGAPMNTVEEYNPQRNEWVVKTSMPTPRSGFATSVYQNKIYVIGGTINGNAYIGNNEIYDPATNTWQTKASMPTPRADLTANVVGDKIYLIGGKHYSSKVPYFEETNICEVYDPATDTWTAKRPLPTGVQGHASAVIGAKIYIMGGSRQHSSLGNTVIVNNNQVYDVQTDNWTLAAGLPITNSYGAAAVTEGFLAPQRIYHIGGFSKGEFIGETHVYDSTKNTWSSADPMPTPRAYLGLVMVNDVLYALGGFDGKNWLNTVEEFKPVGYGKVQPIVQVVSPENKTYTDVLLHFTVDRATDWVGYSIDNQANITVDSQITLTNLIQGGHSVTVYANDSLGNMGVSKPVFFSIDVLPPTIKILLPQNTSYDTTDIQLAYTVDENVTSLAYSLDRQPKEPIAGNVTLAALSDGIHRITVYATDEVGNSSEESIVFSVSPFPIISVVAVLTIITIIVSSGFIVYNHKKTSPKK